MKTMIDPPNGWKYGFPKELPSDVKDVKAWLIKEGYPEKDIIFATENCRMWEEKTTDVVNHPAHYTQGTIETIDFIEDKQLDYHLGNVVKYITRAKHKGTELQDLKKAQWYLNRYIKNKESK
jgi:hypothetical protein